MLFFKESDLTGLSNGGFVPFSWELLVNNFFSPVCVLNSS